MRESIEYIDELEKTGKFEKAKLIAEQYSISFDEIKEAFSLGEQLYREIEINAIEAKDNIKIIKTIRPIFNFKLFIDFSILIRKKLTNYYTFINVLM